MKFTITEKKIKVPDEIKEYAERKVGRINRFFRGEAVAFITFSSERGRKSPLKTTARSTASAN